MKKLMKRLLCAFLALCLCAGAFLLPSCEEDRKGAAPALKDCGIIHEPEFGGVYIKNTIEEFNALGFVYGDSVDISFSNGYTITDIPYYNGYYTANGELLLVAYPGYDYIKAAVNNGDDLWDAALLEEGMTATVTRNAAGRYLSIQKARDIHYTDDRSKFKSDEVFANFRSIRAGSLLPDTVYRSASPCDNQHKRATYVDALISDAGIGFILNLADSDEKIRKYMCAEDFACPYFAELYESGNVTPIALNMNYGSDEFRVKVAAGLAAMAEHEGPYLIHCTEGKDRTGFVCMLVGALAGASWDELERDYMITYENYYGITKQDDRERYDVIVENVFVPMVQSMAGDETADVKKADLRILAEEYLTAAGMDLQTLTKLKERIVVFTEFAA